MEQKDNNFEKFEGLIDSYQPRDDLADTVIKEREAQPPKKKRRLSGGLITALSSVLTCILVLAIVLPLTLTPPPSPPDTPDDPPFFGSDAGYVSEYSSIDEFVEIGGAETLYFYHDVSYVDMTPEVNNISESVSINLDTNKVVCLEQSLIYFSQEKFEMVTLTVVLDKNYVYMTEWQESEPAVAQIVINSVTFYYKTDYNDDGLRIMCKFYYGEHKYFLNISTTCDDAEQVLTQYVNLLFERP